MKKTLKGIRVGLAAGHTPDGTGGSGATGEKAWNTIMVDHMRSQLSAKGAMVYVHAHEIVGYGARMQDYFDSVKATLGSADVIWDFHYNAYNGTAKGFEMLYAHSESLARSVTDEFAISFPKSVLRGDRGLKQCLTGNGSGFLVKSPWPALLPEPFFGDNPNEVAVFGHAQATVASAYVRGLEKYFGVYEEEPESFPVDPPSLDATLDERLSHVEDYLKHSSHFLPL